MSGKIILNQYVREAAGFFPLKPFINPDKAFYRPETTKLSGINDSLDLNNPEPQILTGISGVKSYLMQIK